MAIQKPGLGTYQVGDLSGDLTDGRRLRSTSTGGCSQRDSDLGRGCPSRVKQATDLGTTSHFHGQDAQDNETMIGSKRKQVARFSCEHGDIPLTAVESSDSKVSSWDDSASQVFLGKGGRRSPL